MDVLIWGIIFIAFVIAELATTQLVSIWLALGALVTLIVTYCFEIPLLFQLAIFIAVSAVSLIITLPLLRKKINGGKIATNSELDIGKTATVTEDIDSFLGTGRVSLNGVYWKAVSAADKAIPKGSTVIVKEINGTELVVEPKNAEISTAQQ